ncbi:MAG: nitroreductase/quinone reductase family protein [Dehalococcoidia bacterium]|jgi:membrane-bound serine protease (ClpP class)|nr:nitroreductase/quinone reductase family protein [Dehalococcoidia bacterium]
MTLDPALASEQYCYLTTTGRSSGEPREIEIWFGIANDTLYLMSGGRDRSHWVRNIRKQPRVSVRIAGQTLSGTAREVTASDEDALARHLLLERYAPGYERDLTEWGRAALPVAIDVARADAARTAEMPRRGPPLATALAALSALALVVAACAAESDPGAVHVLTADAEVNGVLQRYIDRGIDRAERDDGSAVVLLIDTPGGSIDAMRDIVSRIETAEVPVLTFVSPPAARAASAGTFIAMAGHLAAMAPNTTIGAATPVTGTGGDIEGALGRKVTNDTVAFARAVAERRGPEAADWAEAAVREAASLGPGDALALGVVDLLVPSLTALLAEVEGREVTLLSGETVTLDVVAAEVVFNNRNFYERVLGIISNPIVVSILVVVGLAGLAIEFFNPGLFLPGVVGITATIASFLGVGTLLPGEAAVAFLVLGIALFVLEAFVPSGGILGSVGAIVIVLGLSILVGQGTTDTDLKSILIALAVGALAIALMVGAFVALVARNYISPTGVDGEPYTNG